MTASDDSVSGTKPRKKKTAKVLAQPIKWHGGKFYLADWIIGMMPPHLHYVEPFFGGGAVLLARDPERDWMGDGTQKQPAHLSGCSEVVNDLNGQLSNFWQVLGDPVRFQELQRQVEITPFSSVAWEEAEEHLTSADSVAAAVAFFVRARQSRQGLMKSFATLSRSRTRRSMNEQVASYLSAIEGLPEIHHRLQSVVILNQDACSLIRQQDGLSTLFYCDPPYLHETRTATEAYELEMNSEQHQQLLETLASIQGKFLLSGYRSELYDSFAAKNGWRREDKLIDNKASSHKVKEVKCECLWMNF